MVDQAGKTLDFWLKFAYSGHTGCLDLQILLYYRNVKIATNMQPHGTIFFFSVGLHTYRTCVSSFVLGVRRIVYFSTETRFSLRAPGPGLKIGDPELLILGHLVAVIASDILFCPIWYGAREVFCSLVDIVQWVSVVVQPPHLGTRNLSFITFLFLGIDTLCNFT